MSDAGNATSETATTTEPKPKVARWRRILCAVLVVIVCVLVPVSILAVWTHNTLLNTDQYVDTVGPLAGKRSVQEAIADRIVIVLKDKVDLESKVEEALPERAKFVVPFVAQGIRGFIHDQALTLLESQRFRTLWDNANRRAHGQVVAVLTGNEDGRVQTEDGKVTVQLGPIVETVRSKLESLGVDVFDSANVSKTGELVLFQSEDLTKIQGGVDLLDQIATILPILLLVLLIAAIALSGNRRRTILRTAIGIAFATGLTLIIFRLLRSVYLDALSGVIVNKDAAGDAYDQIISFLRLSFRTAFAVSIVVAIGTWLAGPGRYATKIREGVQGLASGDDTDAIEQSSPGRFVSRNKTPLRVVVVGIALLVLVVLSAVTPLTVLVVAIIVVLGLLLIEFLGRGGPGEPDDSAEPADTATKTTTATKTAAKKTTKRST